MRSDNSVGMVEEKREREIPAELAILDKELEGQYAAIESLREALKTLFSSNGNILLGSDEKIATPDSSNLKGSILGSQVKAFRERISHNTKDIEQILNALEL